MSGGATHRIFKLCWLVLYAIAAPACQISEPRVFSDNPRTLSTVVGKNIKEARDILEGEGFLVRMELKGVPPNEAPDNDAALQRCPTGSVKEQDPPGNSSVVKASTVTLIIVGCG